MNDLMKKFSPLGKTMYLYYIDLCGRECFDTCVIERVLSFDFEKQDWYIERVEGISTHISWLSDALKEGWSFQKPYIEKLEVLIKLKDIHIMCTEDYSINLYFICQEINNTIDWYKEDFNVNEEKLVTEMLKKKVPKEHSNDYKIIYKKYVKECKKVWR